MTLYKKWDIGKNVMFLSGIIMLIALFSSWFYVGKWDKTGLGLSQYFFENMKEYGDLYSAFDENLANQIKIAHISYILNNFRWLLLIPIAYPISCLFRTNYKKSICCLSALITVVLSIVALVFGIRYFNAVPYIFILSSIVFFAGTTMASETFKGERKQATNTIPIIAVSTDVFCPQCGTQNISDAKFCLKCGTSLLTPTK